MTDAPTGDNTPGKTAPFLKPETARKILSQGILILLALSFLACTGQTASAAADMFDKTGAGSFLIGITVGAVFLIVCPAIGYGMYRAFRAVPDSEAPAFTHKTDCPCTCPTLTNMDVATIAAVGLAMALFLTTGLMAFVTNADPSGAYPDTYNAVLIAINITTGALLATYPVHGVLRYRPKTPRT